MDVSCEFSLLQTLGSPQGLVKVVNSPDMLQEKGCPDQKPAAAYQ